MTESSQYLFLRNKYSDSEDDPWDDEELIKEYDNALQMARTEVAQRLAMDTNSKGKSHKSKKYTEKCHAKNENMESKWKEGDYCRATFMEDGREYEAIILSIEENNAHIMYIGYENEEIIDLSELHHSCGHHERTKQHKEAQSRGYAPMKESSDNVSEGSKAVPSKKRSVSSKKTSDKHIGVLPAFPPSMPPFVPNLGNVTIPPPPPMFLGANDLSSNNDEDKALHSMLISWYMTGYYTGLYQGKKMAQRSSVKTEPNK